MKEVLKNILMAVMIIAPLGWVMFFLVSEESKIPCMEYHGEVLTSHIIQPSFSRNWIETAGKVKVLETGQIVQFNSRPDNLYEVGDIIIARQGCGAINQEFLLPPLKELND